MDITDGKFKELTDLTVSMVEDTELGKNKDMAPMLMVHFREMTQEPGKQMEVSDIQGAIVVIAGGFDDKTKNTTVRAIGKQFFDKKWFPVAVFMVSESWVSHIAPEDLDNPDRPMPRDDPNREECIMIAGRTPAADCKVGVSIPIIHDSNGIMTRKGENIVVNELEMYLLNQFFHGFFKTITTKYTKEQMEDMVAKYKSGGRA